ncbi:MAG: carbon-nitrogen hydrolase family protein [Sedimentisphaerales bacterium]
MEIIGISSIQPPYFEEKSIGNNDIIISRGFEYLTKSLKMSAKICCLPEYFNVFGLPTEAISSMCDNYEEILRKVSELAGKFSSYIILPMIVPENGKYFNRAYLIGPNGSIIGYYDKLHLTITEKEELLLEPGNKLGIFETDYGKVVITICYDIYFSELYGKIATEKPDIVFLPSLQRGDHEIASEAMLKTRAMDTRAYLVRSSYGQFIGLPWQKNMGMGQSCIVHPDGTILANSGHYEGFAIANTHVPFIWKRPRCSGYECQKVSEFLNSDRRPEFYT